MSDVVNVFSSPWDEIFDGTWSVRARVGVSWEVVGMVYVVAGHESWLTEVSPDLLAGGLDEHHWYERDAGAPSFADLAEFILYARDRIHSEPTQMHHRRYTVTRLLGGPITNGPGSYPLDPGSPTFEVKQSQGGFWNVVGAMWSHAGGTREVWLTQVVENVLSSGWLQEHTRLYRPSPPVTHDDEGDFRLWAFGPESQLGQPGTLYRTEYQRTLACGPVVVS